MKEYSVCYSYLFCHGFSCQGTHWRHSRQRTQPGPGFMVLCSLKPKAARNLGFRVSDIINTGIMRLQESVKGFDAVFPVRMVQGLSTVHQQESGIQVSLDPPSIYDIVAPGEFFLYIGVGYMVVLAGPEGFGIHFQIPAAQGFQFPLQDAAELGGCPGLQAFSEPFSPCVFSVFFYL